MVRLAGEAQDDCLKKAGWGGKKKKVRALQRAFSRHKHIRLWEHAAAPPLVHLDQPGHEPK